MPRVATTSDSRRFDPSAFRTFRFVDRSIDDSGRVRLRYALDDMVEFEEQFDIPLPGGRPAHDAGTIEGLLSLLHWVAGVSYFKTAVPQQVSCESGAPTTAVANLLEALYSEGLGEFAVANGLPRIPRPAFPASSGGRQLLSPKRAPSRVLVPVGGGKDSVVALELVRRSGLELSLFSVGNAHPIQRTAATAGLPRLVADRRIDGHVATLNSIGALNGHVPVTAIVSCVALLTAAVHGFDTVALANERSASAGNTVLDGVEINHQFSKSARAERLLRDAVAEIAPELEVFSILRPASELAIARAFARLPEYHRAFTSCNRVFKLDPSLRSASWCCDCDKCRFVFLILAPFLAPPSMEEIFGRPMLNDDDQYPGFALLTGTGGHKPFECVGEIEESVAAVRLLAGDSRWRAQRVVRRLADEVLPRFSPSDGDPQRVLALADDHFVPSVFLDEVNEILGH